MRPARFESFLRDLFRDVAGQVEQVCTVQEAGVARHPYGLVVTYSTGARVLLQIVGTTAPGDDLSAPEQAVEGDAPAGELPVPAVVDRGRVLLERVEAQVAGLVVNSGSREVAGVEVFSRRKQPGAVRFGARFDFHSGAVVLRTWCTPCLPGVVSGPRGGRSTYLTRPSCGPAALPAGPVGLRGAPGGRAYAASPPLPPGACGPVRSAGSVVGCCALRRRPGPLGLRRGQGSGVPPVPTSPADGGHRPSGCSAAPGRRGCGAGGHGPVRHVRVCGRRVPGP